MVHSIKIPGITCSIVVAGEKLKEYDCPEDDKDENASITKYIETVSESMYSIQITFDSSYRLDCEWLLISVTIDGTATASVPLRHHHLTKRPYIRLVTGKSVLHADGHGSQKCFKFATLKTIEDCGVTKTVSDVRALSQLGQIDVEFHRRAGGIIEKRIPDQSVNTPPAEISEKMMKGKAIDQTTAFITRPSRPPAHTVRGGEWLDGKENPSDHIVFRYRSRAALQTEMIIARDSTPDPFEQLTQKEKEALARQQFEAQAKSN